MKQQRNNRRRRNNKKGNTAPQLQLNRQINLFSKKTSALINISVPVFIYAYQPSLLYSFSGSSDSRSYPFNVISATVEFTNFSMVYANYKINSFSVIVTPMELNTPAPILYVGLHPEGASGNPTNSTFITSDKLKMFSPVQTSMQSVTFRTPGVGLTTNIWKSVATAPDGEFIIGNNTAAGVFASTFLIFDCQLSFLVEFNNAI